MTLGKALRRNWLLIAVLLGAAWMGRGQSPSLTTPGSAAASSQVLGKPAATANFHSDLLDLNFSYPASLVAQTLPDLKAQHEAIAQQRPQATTEDRKTDECTDKALLATRADHPTNAQPTVTFYGDKRGVVVDVPPHAITGKILISRIGVDCMPASYREQIDNVATAMSSALAQDQDLYPIDRPIWYPIGNTHVHFAAGESAAPKDQTTSTKQSRWVGSAAFVWGGNLVSIVIESNDLKFFNEMLHSTVALGKGAPGSALFPAEIGNGKPIQPKD